MNVIWRHSFLTLLLALSPAVFATEIVHNFGTKLNTDHTLELTNSNTVGTSTNDNIVYTGYDGAGFAAVNYKTSLYFPGKNDSVVIRPAFEKLSQLVLFREGVSAGDNQLKVYVSSDGATWTMLTGTQINYDASAGEITATIPSGKTFIKIINTKAAARSIWKIRYAFLDCDCFHFTPEP